METVTVEEAEDNFSAVLRLVRAGEEVEVIHHKAPVAKIDLMPVAIAVTSRARQFATLDSEQAKLARAVGLKPVEFQA